MKLNNGVEIPQIGFGTWTLEDHDVCVKAVKDALNIGYTHIDTASIYKNEAFVGEAIKDYDRSKLFITTNLWNDVRGYDETIKAFNDSLDALGLDYLDMYLIHWPNPVKYRENYIEKNIETWRAMEDLYKARKVRAIGVCSFWVHHLEELMEKTEIKPAVNQMEYHPNFFQDDIVDFCKKNDIAIEAWSPLGKGRLIKKK